MSKRATRSRPYTGRGRPRPFPPTVPVEDDIGRQELDEAIDLAAVKRSQEPAGEFLLVFEVGPEAWFARIDSRTRAGKDLAAVRFALVNDLSDLVVAVVEDLAQQEHGALDGESVSSRTKNESDNESAISASSAGPGSVAVITGSGSHGPK
jgi:hypothetical protein